MAPRLPPHPVEVVDQVTTLILMEEQVTETVFGCIKLIIWKKLSKFIQVSCSIYQCQRERCLTVAISVRVLCVQPPEPGGAELLVGEQQGHDVALHAGGALLCQVEISV